MTLRQIWMACAVAMGLTATAANDGPTVVRVADRPDNTATSNNYVNARAPLRQQNFIKLPVGSVKPRGWVGRYLQLQRDGLTGHLGEISAWLDKHNNAWLVSGGDHGWEEVPYWLKGYSDLAYLLNDRKMLGETRVWIEAILNSQREDGSFGPINVNKGRPELWAQMIALATLQTYYEYSHDARVISLMTRYFKWQLALPDDQFLKDYWENSRGGDNLYTVLWLYNRTGDRFLLDLARKIHRNTANWHQATALPNWHNVNVAQCFREPATYYMLTGDTAMLRASYNTHRLIRRIFGQVPGGMFGADENARMGYIDPRQCVETCGMVEQMASDEIMLRFTGDPYWAENCEDVAFNSYPAAVMPDFRALRYLTAPNMVVSDSKNHSPGIQNSGPFLAMNPFSSRCCQHNHAQGWPYYAENLVYATPDNGVAAVMYAACTAEVRVANGKTIVLAEDTHYPFADTISFRIERGRAHFPLYLRIPTWAQGAEVWVNGQRADTPPVTGKYYVISREWNRGDRVVLRLPMRLTARRWSLNKNSVSVNYGPLTLSLRIRERYVRCDSRKTAIGDSGWQAGADASLWPTTEIYPGSPWNYALVEGGGLLHGIRVSRKPWPTDDFPFALQSVPLEFSALARRVPSWTIDEYGLCGVLPDEDAPKSPVIDEVTLVPMGAARLRISAFPTVAE